VPSMLAAVALNRPTDIAVHNKEIFLSYH